MRRHLLPLAVAANITQAAHCRLDHVLLTFGILFLTYWQYYGTARAAIDCRTQRGQLPYVSDTDDLQSFKAVMASIERRWQKSDKEVFIAALILNPMAKNAIFKANQDFVLQNIFSMFETLWLRFYTTPIPQEFYQELDDYLKGVGFFQNMGARVREAEVKAISVCINYKTLFATLTFYLCSLSSLMYSYSGMVIHTAGGRRIGQL